MTVLPLGDSAVVIAVGETLDEATTLRARAVANEIQRHAPAGVVDVVPAFGNVAIFYEPAHAPRFPELSDQLRALAARADATVASVPVRTVELPICYGGEFGPDLEHVAQHNGLGAAEVIAQHAAANYIVHAIGFAPGFPYLGGLSPALATPRRATPRPRVPAGSVGIGGAQTGVYPLVTPGGWNLIGRTPLALFDAQRDPPARLRAGDHVKCRPISPEEFERSWKSAFTPETLAAEVGDKPRPAIPGIEITRAGMFTTVQDLGRRGHRVHGVPLSGAADPLALRVANLLVGNRDDAAALEFTLVGPELMFLQDTLIALGGADFGGPPRWRPFRVAAGAQLKLGPAPAGCRGYLAIAGGIATGEVLGSRSTYVRAAIGGLEGRPLRDGDVLPVAAVQRDMGDHWRIDERILPPYSASPTVRVIPGVHAAQFDADWTQRSFSVTPQSDRMGVRLGGASLARRVTRELVSMPVAPGTIQVPPDGQPIVLLADAQTIGGYPQLAHVASVDLPLVAQLRPGDAIAFRLITLEEAHELLLTQEKALALLREGLAQKLA